MRQLEQITRTSCRGCHGVCQVLVHRDSAGTITKITGDADSPTSSGYICPKGIHAAKTLYHPDRIVRPLLRKKGRGENVWEAISWDAATDLMAERFGSIREKFGAEYIALAQGTGRPYTEFTGRFCHALGSPNFVGPAHNCFIPRNICAGITLGWFPQPDIYGRGGAMPKCLMIFGSNVMESGGADGYCGKMVASAFKQAEKTIVVDPRATDAARASSLHLALRPGTECALLLAMIHTIIRDKAYDADFVEQHCVGFAALKAHVQPFSPAWAAPITRLSVQDIEDAALSFARISPASLIWGNGIDESVSAFQTARAMFILLALCGTLDIPGGMVLWVPPADIRCKSFMVDTAVSGMHLLSPAQKAKVISTFPFCPGAHPPSFWQACVHGQPYRPKALWLVGTNPVLTHTRGDLVQQALRDHLEFTVCSEFVMAPMAVMADLVLPAAHWLEQDDVVYFHKIWCVLARKKLAQIGECRDDRAVILDLAHKLGLEAVFPWKSWDEYLAWLLEPTGMDFATFAAQDIVYGEMRYRKYESTGFPTPSGKVELESSVMRHKGLPALPVYTEPPLSPLSAPELAKEYPFILMTGCKIRPFFHTEGRNIPELRRLHPEPLLEMCPETAQGLGLEEGQRVRVSTPYGAQEFVLHKDERLTPDVVHAEHAWWFPEQEGPDYGCFTSNANLLFNHDHFDPLSGAESLKSFLCRVEALK